MEVRFLLGSCKAGDQQTKFYFSPGLINNKKEKMKLFEKEKEVDNLFKKYFEKTPGLSVGILYKNDFIYKKSFGLASLKTKKKITSKTNFRLASVTKQFTAYAILELASKNKINLKDNLNKFFPDFADYGKEITLYHLLTHTSGLKDCPVSRDRKKPLLDQEIFETLKRNKKPSFKTGTRFYYCNDGYALLRFVIEKVAKTSFLNYLRKNIFIPLGMKNTVVNEENKTLIKNRAYGNVRKKGKYVEHDQSITSFTEGAGGIYSSIEDLAKWNKELDNPKLLKKSLLKRDFTPQKLKNGKLAYAHEDHAHYGFGFFIGKNKGYKVVFHGGSTMGFRTSIYKIPQKHLTILVLSNCVDSDGSDIARKIFEVIK